MRREKAHELIGYRVIFALALCLIGASIALAGLGVFTGSAQAQGKGAKASPDQDKKPRGVISVPSAKNDLSPSLRDQPPWPVTGNEFERHAKSHARIPHQHIDQPDPVMQNARASTLARLAPSIPAPIRNFDGIPFPGLGCNCAPPAPVGEVGATQYVQMVNQAFQVFDKITGNSVLGPASIESIWAGFGGVCETNGSGDPIVLYDQLANRWVISQFADSPPRTECIAVSTTSDATGSYNRYAFTLNTANFYDYPHLGVWPDGYYMSMNVFNSAGTAYLGPQAFAFDRAKMLAGLPATFVTTGITGGPDEETFLPADLDGSNLPASGAPATFVFWPGGASTNTYRVYHFHADFVTPANTTFTPFAAVPAAGFTEMCPATRACIPQLGVSAADNLDAVGDRLMFRLAYRKFADGHEAVVGNFTVNSAGVAGIRWFELRNVTAGPVTLFQESTYQPDTIHRWMGSAAMDGNGSIAIGFSASSASINPQVRYAGRLATDSLGALAQGEATLFAGTGSQTGTSNLWGDHSSLTVDPVDDSTFWYTSEYYAVTGPFAWRTRIGSFKIPTTPTNNIVAGGSYVVSAGANGVLDPGEVVTVALGLKNSGGPGNPCTTALMGTLQAGGGVTSPPAAQNYGVVCANDPVVFRYFTFTVDPARSCGSTITATLNVTDGATTYGPFTYTLPTGVTTSTSVQNFDGVTAPALPVGWTAAASGSGTNPTTVTTFPDTAPNSLFTLEGTDVGLSEITSPPVTVAGAAQLIFRNEFNTELTFDGKVLEIAIPGVVGGAFQDILVAGGSFVTGGYNSTLSTAYSNPLPGRMAWSGLSGGTAAAPSYITTAVNLPAAASGQMVQFKWRQGSDSSVTPATNPGSRVDSVTLSSTVCGGNAPTVTSAVSRKNHGGTNYDVPLPLVAVNGTIGVEPRSGPSHTVVVTFANPVTVSGTALTTGTGSATSVVAGNVVTVSLTGVADVQRLAVTLTGVSDGMGNIGDVIVPMGVLLGDAVISGGVNSTDVAATKAGTSPGTVTGANFRSDVNAGGSINSTDVSIVKSRAGASLPP